MLLKPPSRSASPDPSCVCVCVCQLEMREEGEGEGEQKPVLEGTRDDDGDDRWCLFCSGDVEARSGTAGDVVVFVEAARRGKGHAAGGGDERVAGTAKQPVPKGGEVQCP